MVTSTAQQHGDQAALEVLVNEYRSWIVAHSDIPFVYEETELPEIKFVSPHVLERVTGLGPSARVRAAYEVASGRSVIYLSRDWDGGVYDQSYFFHEVVHDLQYRNKTLHPVCVIEDEMVAYKLQAYWAYEQGYPMPRLARKEIELRNDHEC